MMQSEETLIIQSESQKALTASLQCDSDALGEMSTT